MLPKSWNDISVSQYKELRQLGKTPADSITERYIDTILTLTDIPLEDVEEMSMDSLIEIVDKIRFIKTEPSTKYAKKLGDYQVLPFNKLTWGAFIDLEFYISKDYIEHIEIVTGVLLRKVMPDTWGVTQYEPYNYHPKQRGEELLNVPITGIYGIVQEYVNYRNDLINNKYAELFNRSLDDDEEEELNGQDLAEYNKRKGQERAFNKWSYESITYDLAKEDVTKMNDVLDLPLIYILNILSMRHEMR